MKLGEDLQLSDRRFSQNEEINPFSQEERGSAITKINSNPKSAVWPIYTKKRSSVLSRQDEPLCKAVISDVPVEIGTVGGRELSRESATNLSEGVPEKFVTSGSSSTLECFLAFKLMRVLWLLA